MSGFTIVDGRPDHLPEVAEIYAAAIAGGVATFDLESPPMAWWRALLDAADPALGHLLLVALGADGAVLGYAKSGSFRPKAAYASTCELSIYIDAAARGRGVGTALYEALLGRLDRSGLRVAVAGVTEPNPPSARLHQAHGFQPIGKFTGVGVKFGRAWDVSWYQRPLRSAELLDELSSTVRAARSPGDALPGVAAALSRAGHERAELYDVDTGILQPVSLDPDAPHADADGAAPPDVDLDALAPGRPLVLDDGAQALAPVIDPRSRMVVGAVGSHAGGERRFDRLDEGFLTRCAEMLVPLWSADVRHPVES